MRNTILGLSILCFISLSILCFMSVARSQATGWETVQVTAEARSVDSSTGMVRIVDPVHDRMVGQMAADVEFAEEDGTRVKLSAFRGKPLLIDLWATWCAPCLKALPEFDRIYREVKDKGLTVITFDHDKEPDTAILYLARKHYYWTNFHDPDGNVEKALGDSGLPLTILIDAQGKYVYFSLGGETAGLRKAIAGLGPGFASLTQKIESDQKSVDHSNER